jgi:uncharacterized membrane protein HdeD (DUF308 family)
MATTKTGVYSGGGSTIANYWWVWLIKGIAAVLLGFLLLTNPAASAVAIVIYLGAYWLVTGIIDIVQIFTRSEGRLWNAITGIIGILAGIAVLNHPLTATIAVGATLVYLIAFLAIINGIAGLVSGFSGGFELGAVALGALNLLIGIWLLFNPLGSLLALPVAIGIFLLASGILQIVNSFRLRGQR